MRFARLGLDDLQGEARDLADRVLQVSADGLGGPFNLLLRSPRMGAKMMALLSYFNEESQVLDPVCRRLAVLVLAREAGAIYAWWTHCRRALARGEFSQDVIDAINRRAEPPGLDARQQATVAFARDLARNGRSSDASFAALRGVMAEDEVVELIVCCGTYATVAMVLAEGEVGLPEGAVDTLIRDPRKV